MCVCAKPTSLASNRSVDQTNERASGALNEEAVNGRKLPTKLQSPKVQKSQTKMLQKASDSLQQQNKRSPKSFLCPLMSYPGNQQFHSKTNFKLHQTSNCETKNKSEKNQKKSVQLIVQIQISNFQIFKFCRDTGSETTATATRGPNNVAERFGNGVFRTVLCFSLLTTKTPQWMQRRRTTTSPCRSVEAKRRNIGACCVPFVRSFAASVRSPTLNVEGAMSVVCCVVSDVVLPSPASLVVMATTKFSIIHE